MNIFRVGGAVRDRLLGYAHHETDWVVVGSTPDEMIKNGFTQVGRDFPVFLHPESKEEYALAALNVNQGPAIMGSWCTPTPRSRLRRISNAAI